MKFNSINSADFIHLFATYMSIYDPNYKCKECLMRYDKNHRDEKKFCTKKSNAPIANYGGFDFFNCPSNYSRDSYAKIIIAYRQYTKGILPFTGGIMEQPSQIMECFDIISGLDLELEKKNKERVKKWQPKEASQLTSRSKKKKP